MNLQVSVADISQCRKDLTVEIPVDDVKAAYEKTYSIYARHVKSPGFRQGRVPREVIKQRFAKEVKDEVLSALLPEALKTAVVEHKLDVVGDPQISELSFKEGEPLKFRATLEVMPGFELKEYKGLKLTRRVAAVTDKAVETTLENLRKSSGEFVPIEDRLSQDGDFVLLSLVGKNLESPEETDLNSEEEQLQIGVEGFQPEFSENLRGVKTGDVREFPVKYPEDFQNKLLAGKTIHFTATVKAVHRKELPELDDAFARDVGEFENLQQLRDNIRANLNASLQTRADSEFNEAVSKRILEGYDFEVPYTMIERQANERANQLAYLMMRNGVSTQEIKEMDWKGRMNNFRKLAVGDVRLTLIMETIARVENVQVSGWEIDTEIKRLAQMNGEDAEQLKARLTKEDSLSSIENRLRHGKAFEAVIKHAEVTVEEFNEDQSGHQAQSPEQTDTEAEVRSEGKSQSL